MKNIVDRQKAFADGKNKFPICIFPEGTTSNGKTLIAFKKGAFLGLSPIKPYIVKYDESSFSLGTGGMNLLLHMLITLTFPYLKFDTFVLPVFKPNEYLNKNWSTLGKDEAEIYAEALRRSMSEISGIPISDSSFETKLEYMSHLKKKIIKNT